MCFDMVKPTLSASTTSSSFPPSSVTPSRHKKPWVRIISCSENEIEDPDIPPHLSGAGAKDKKAQAAYRKRFNQVIKPIHDNFNAFLKSVGEKKYPLGQFFEASPHMNILLYPERGEVQAPPQAAGKAVPVSRRLRAQGKALRSSEFKANDDKPLLYVSFGSLGSGDTELLKRLIAAIGKMPVRALVNVGDYKDQYSDIPPNVIIDSWFPPHPR